MIRRSPGHHLGGPHPRRLSLEAGAPVHYPSGRRVQGRTPAMAAHANEFKLDFGGFGIQTPAVPEREARRSPLVAPPRRKHPR